MRLPPLFVSHGSPMLALDRTPAHAFLSGLGRSYEAAFGRPRAILCASAHWETARPAIGAAERPETIHDFHGFPPALFAMRYPAPGAPEMARRAAALLQDAGLPCDLDPTRGLDHGAWVPLSLMWPDAGIPVAQVAIQQALGPEHHLRLGAALAPLADEGVLVFGSGSATHNLRELDRANATAAPPWAAEFDAWLDRSLQAGNIDALVRYGEQAPAAARAHPRDEHLLPLFVPLGTAGSGARAVRLHAGFEYGSLSMAAWRFGPDSAAISA